MGVKSDIIDFYQLNYLWKIVKEEEKKGKLKKNYFSDSVIKLSSFLKQKRKEFRSIPKIKRKDCQNEIDEIKEELDSMKKSEISECAKVIFSGKAQVNIKKTIIKDHEVFVASDLNSMIISQLIKLELRRSYRLRPANRDMIIDQIKALLDNPMPKVVIRADIQSFFESISQEKIIKKLADDNFISNRSLKYLRKFMYEYNISKNSHTELGVPRGLAFSSYMAELYLNQIDKEIKYVEGVYFYKRYVDDIIIVADPKMFSAENYWELVNSIFENNSLSLHNISPKKYIQIFDQTTNNAEFEYLGYHFSYSEGRLKIGLSSKRYCKYKTLIDIVFENYKRSSNYRKGKNSGTCRHKLRRDALSLLFKRLKIITSNGILSGRKNYVATGIYYSNKFITDFSQLELLDKYLYEKITNKDCFNPSRKLFNYGAQNNYDKNIQIIKQKLGSFSFIEGFKSRKLHKSSMYSKILSDLQKMYNLNNADNE